ncbi:MAG: metallophosphoesterase, partial [Candidatus Aegiribacteria sp.]|nr:metallophosphoesterase [Candidatus Aegiribacteria sp.]
MRVFAIGDLHLSLSTDKPMDLFGDHWKDHHVHLEANWRKRISHNDLILLPGDLSWAMNLDEAEMDLEWLANLPGRKIILKGN